MAEKATRTTTSATAANISLEASKSDRHVWLMKCPPIVYRVLHSAPLPPPPDTDSSSSSALPSDRPVAKVIVAVPLISEKESKKDDDVPLTSKDSKKDYDLPLQFMMELAGSEPGNIPKCYSMDMSTDFIPMSIFSESVQGRLSVEGKIYHKFDMRPHNENIEKYGKLCRERTNKYMTKSRQIQVIDNDNGKHMRPMPGIFASKPSGSAPEKKKAPTKGSELKRTRRDRDEMEEIMFKLFERQPNWTLKQLIQETDQPEQFLKNMLKLLCVYNNKGTNQGTYELKPEYKRSEDS